MYIVRTLFYARLQLAHAEYIGSSQGYGSVTDTLGNPIRLKCLIVRDFKG